MAAGSVGAQIILDYNGSGSLGARGGAGPTLEETRAAYDAHRVALGLDPNAPSGPPTVPDPGAAGRGRPGATRAVPHVHQQLMAGIITGGPALPRLRLPRAAVRPGRPTLPLPAVTQAADILTATMGEWTGEPTTYSYQWKVDGAVVGTDAATHTVTSADAGKVATCIVTATNAMGSTAAPPSVDLVVTDPGATTTRSKK